MSNPTEHEIILNARATELWNQIKPLQLKLHPLLLEHAEISMELLDMRRERAEIRVLAPRDKSVKSTKKDKFIGYYNDLTPEQRAQFMKAISQ